MIDHFRHSKVLSLIDNTDKSILNSTVPQWVIFIINKVEVSNRISFNNRIYNPHPNHNIEQGGVITSTGLLLDPNTIYTENDTVTREYFFDDDGMVTSDYFILMD